MSRWEPTKGDYAGGALNILKAFAEGQLGYPKVTLALAGEEANASRAGDMRAKETIHKIIEIISDNVHRAGLKQKGMGFQDVEVPRELREKILAEISPYVAMLQGSAVREAVRGKLRA